MKIVETTGFKNAQVTAGGVLLEDIDLQTLESRKVKGVYFAGEILDVDGICGGYNLQWAWTSGYLAGKGAANAQNQSAEASGYAYGRGFEEKDCAHTDVQDRSGTEL